MTTTRQAEANALNALKSTGPRTPAGRAVVAYNAMKHGLLSRESLVKGESEPDLVDFGRRLRAQLATGGRARVPPRGPYRLDRVEAAPACRRGGRRSSTRNTPP